MLELKEGSILFWKDFKFSDGDLANKLFLILKIKDFKYLACKTTSQKHYKINSEGCYFKQGYYMLPSNKKTNLPKDTWVILSEPFLFDATDILNAKFNNSNHADVKNIIEPNTLGAVRNCFKKCYDVPKNLIKFLD